jgi:uncharacterized membrane protein SirB2
MSYSYDYQMAEIHALLGWAAVALFLLRGLAALQFGAVWALDIRVKVMVFGVHFLLAITGLSLWGLRYYNPLRDGWLGAKLVALAAFMGCAHWAMGGEEFDVAGSLFGLLALGSILAVSVTRSPTLGLF